MADDFKQLRAQARQFARDAQRGELGYMGDGSGNVRVSGKSNRVYVRIVRNERAILVQAKNAGAPELDDLEVWVTRTPDNDFIVTGIAIERSMEVAGGQRVSNVGPHDHSFASGMLDIIAGERFLPGMVRVSDDADLSVYVEKIRYVYQGTRQTWPGGEIDLTSYRPATSNHWTWVKVGINPSTNALTAAAGTSQDIMIPLDPEDVDAIALAGMIQLFAIKLRNGQTAINDFRDFEDVREYTRSHDPDDSLNRVLTYDGDVLTYEGDILYS